MPNDANSNIDIERMKFRAVMDGVREGIILLTPEQNVISANEKACTLTGYKNDEIIGKHASEVLYIIDSNDQVIDINLLCPSGGLDMDGVIFKKDSVSLVGKTDVIQIVNIQSRKIKEGSKINLGALVIISDVFEESELERMKTDFVSMAVHMLRTPLTIVKGFLRGLLKPLTIQKLSESEIDDLTAAMAGAEELDRLVENLLHMSEIQQGRFKMLTSSVSYQGLVASVVAEFKALTESKGLKLVFVPPTYELPMIRIDFSRIKEVLKNLLDNAAKFTEDGGIEVSIKREGDFIHTAIKDTGKGIAYTNLEYIFTKFYRIKDPLSMEHGLGLGLFISNQIVEAHKGKIWAESIEGQGTVMHFTLPINL